MAPRFLLPRVNPPSDGEPMTYRGWKKLWQTLLPSSWSADLLDRIESTDWDVLIILDACRYDVLADIAEGAAIERAVSPATATPQFLEAALERGVFDETTYVSANPQTDGRRPGNDITHVQLYDDGWDEVLSTVPPSEVYRAVREQLGAGSRVVAHTLQPHYPHICTVGDGPGPVPGGLHPAIHDIDERHLQSVLANGAVGLGLARRSYRASVRFAWDRAFEFAGDLVADDYTVAITADHGEVFGDWGFVEHPIDIPIAALTNVPWVVVAPHQGTTDTGPARSVEDRLADLGYRQ